MSELLRIDCPFAPVRRTPHAGKPNNRCRANTAHTRQSRPDYGLGFQVKFLKNSRVVPFWIRNAGRDRSACITFFCRSVLCTANPTIASARRLPSELGTNKAVKARIWPWFETFSVRQSFKSSDVFPARSAAGLLLGSRPRHHLLLQIFPLHRPPSAPVSRTPPAGYPKLGRWHQANPSGNPTSVWMHPQLGSVCRDAMHTIGCRSFISSPLWTP